MRTRRRTMEVPQYFVCLRYRGGFYTLTFALHSLNASISKQDTRALDLSIDNVRRLKSKRYLHTLVA